VDSVQNKLVSVICSSADDCFRDVFVEAMYQKISLRREDAVMADLDPHGLFKSLMLFVSGAKR
jgi:hypothetical protein